MQEVDEMLMEGKTKKIKIRSKESTNIFYTVLVQLILSTWIFLQIKHKIC